MPINWIYIWIYLNVGTNNILDNRPGRLNALLLCYACPWKNRDLGTINEYGRNMKMKDTIDLPVWKFTALHVGIRLHSKTHPTAFLISPVSLDLYSCSRKPFRMKYILESFRAVVSTTFERNTQAKIDTMRVFIFASEQRSSLDVIFFTHAYISALLSLMHHIYSWYIWC